MTSATSINDLRI